MFFLKALLRLSWCHQYRVLVATNVSSMEGSTSDLFDAGLESCDYNNKINLIMCIHYTWPAMLFAWIIYVGSLYLQLLFSSSLNILVVSFGTG